MLPKAKSRCEESGGCTVDAGGAGEDFIKYEALYWGVLASDRCCTEKPWRIQWFCPRFWRKGVFSSRTLLDDKLLVLTREKR